MPRYGQFLFGQGLYGSGDHVAPVYLDDTLVFDGFSLSDGDEMVLEALQLKPVREVNAVGVPRRDGKTIITDQYPQYEI